jgi:hypothetical protein
MPSRPTHRVREWKVAAVVSALMMGGVAVWWGWERAPETAAVLSRQVSSPKSEAGIFALIPETLAVLEVRDGYLATLVRLERLSRALPAPDCEQLRDWAAGPQPAGITDAAQWASLVNEVFNVLRRQKQAVDLMDTFAGMIADQGRPSALRAYAVQNLGSWLRHESFQKPEAADLRRQGLEILLTAASGSEVFRGTAMNALCDLAMERPGWIDPVRLDELLVRGVLDDRGEMAGRITLLQLAAQRELKAALPTARRVAADEESRISLRLSAIACLGQIGEACDLELLKTLRTRESSPSASRLQAALEPALARLNQTLGDPALR